MNTIEFENGSLIQTINYESENSHDDIINIYSADDKPVRVCYENNWNVTETTQGKDGELLAEIKRYIATPASLNNCKSCNDEIVILNGQFVGLDYDHDISDKEIYEFFHKRCPDADIKIKHKKPFTCRSLL